MGSLVAKFAMRIIFWQRPSHNRVGGYRPKNSILSLSIRYTAQDGKLNPVIDQQSNHANLTRGAGWRKIIISTFDKLCYDRCKLIPTPYSLALE
jgi:hypothetical protein